MARTPRFSSALTFGVMLGAAAAQGAAAPAAAAPLVGAHAAACAFDGTSHVLVAADRVKKVVDLRSAMTVDLWFQACWKESGDDKDADDGSRCLLSMRYDDHTVHHAVYLGPQLEFIAFDNGVDQELFDYQFAQNAWYHLAVVVDGNKTAVVVNGEPIGVRDIGLGRAVQSVLLVGATSQGRDNFFGAIGPIRYWDTSLSFDEVNWVKQRPGIADLPTLRPHVLAVSNFTDTVKTLEVPAALPPEAAAAAAESFRRAAPFATAVDWRRDFEAAAVEAKTSGKLLAVYTTIAGRDRLCQAMESGPLRSSWWKDVAQECVPVLEVARAPTSARGLAAGSLTLLSAAGAVLWSFHPFDEEACRDGLLLAAQYDLHWRDGRSLDDRAGRVLFDLAGEQMVAGVVPAPVRAQLDGLIAEVAAAEASELARTRVAFATSMAEQWNHLGRIRALQDDYARAQAAAIQSNKEVRAGRPSWSERQRNMQREAFDLWATAPLRIEPMPELVRFATLLVGYALAPENAVDDILQDELLEFARPYGEMVPMAGWEARSCIPLAK